MQTLGEDIVLLALRPDGSLAVWDKLRFALAGSELVRLAAARRVEVVDKRIAVLDDGPIDDPLLAAALDSIRRSQRPPKVTDWVAGRGQRLVDAYLERLDAAGVIRTERRKRLRLFPVSFWFVLDISRQIDARARLDAIARSGGAVDSAQAAYGGLVHAARLDAVLYPGSEGKPARKRLEQIARRDAVTQASTDAAIRATRLATDAAIHASVQASIDAAVSASSSAAHHGGDGGASVGGHH